MSKKALGRGLSALFTQINPVEHDLTDLDIDQIDPAEQQPRHIFRDDKLEELAQSIRVNGIIQPIVVRRRGERFEIIAGERRWRAAQRAGLQRVPSIIKDISDDNALEISLIENIQREELNPIEEAQAYKNIVERLGITQDEVARRVGKDRTSITNSLRLLRLPIEIQQLVEDESISMGHARALLSLDSTDEQIALASQIVNGSLSVRETERLVKKTRNRKEQAPGSVSNIAEIERPNINAAEAKLGKRLGAPVKIKFHQEGGAIEIKFSSTDDLTRLFDLLIQRAGPE
ncbi:MAG TPA: ParB/RepB/Spo0J family partition protein [Blastocatellia bacterium]|nr:ParB/RepB/Spo0J family partition protein [Blastocatellia bacterium]